jgi:hypothetical protein
MATPRNLGALGARTLVLVFVITLCGLSAALVPGASAAVSAPRWSVRAIALPTRFSAAHVEVDKYEVLVTNIGASASNAEVPLVVKIHLSPELATETLSTRVWATGGELECGGEQCEYHEAVAPDGTVAISLGVRAIPTSGLAVSSITVAGGGAEPVEAVVETPITEEQAPFGIQDFGFSATALDGAETRQAGGHPYEQTTSLELMSEALIPSKEEGLRPVQNPRDVSVTLPAGFVGNPLATPRCPLKALTEARFPNERGETLAPCPSGSVVGLITLVDGRAGGAVGTLDAGTLTTPLYNLMPEAGHPAELGFSYFRKYAIVLYADLVRTDAGYRVRVSVPGIPNVAFDGAVVTLFGNPGAHNGETGAQGAFLTNPAQCSDEPATAKVEANSWEEPNHWVTAESVAYPRIEGCDRLQFNPEVHVSPEPSPPDNQPGTTQVDSPGGYAVNLTVPRAETQWNLLSSPELKDVTVTLPSGVSISPSAANGLEGCPATGPNGIDIPHGTAHPDEAGEGETIGPDGLSHLTAGHCPSKSQVGEVEISTPLLEHPLTGALYIAQPKCGGASQPACTEASATNGELYGLYLEAAGSGVIVKLAGKVSADPVTGQLTTTFQENPELPVSEISVKLHGGPRAPLASPQTCGTATTTTVLEPWSAPITPNATPTSSFNVVGCGASMPFAPSFTAGTIAPTSGAFSPFTLTFSRNDGEQDLSALTVTTPPGLLGVLKSAPRCPEPQAQNGECGAESAIGHTQVAAGAGPTPLWESGTVYITGPYKGQPFGLSVVVPAVAGPFNLGNVVIRAAIHVDPTTSALTVVSDRFPQIIDGVPVRVKKVNVTIDRPGYMFNPTSCAQQSISATITAAQGASAAVSSPFAVIACRNLPFKPSFSVSTSGHTSKALGASLHVHVGTKEGPGGGEANIAKVDVELPSVLPSQLKTLQKACTAAQFAIDPAGCPEGSFVGVAVAHTPILSSPLSGPAILVSHGGAAFPDLVVVLQGEGIRIDLTGNTQIVKGRTFSRFNTVPDAPVTSFDLTLPQGPHAALTAVGSLCATGKTVTTRKKVTRRVHGRTIHTTKKARKFVAQPLLMPTTMVAQNGAVLNQSTKIAVTGCPVVKAAKHAGRASGKRGRRR